MQRIIVLFILLAMTARPVFAQNIKNANVSGQFYDADPQKLSQSVDGYLRAANVTQIAENIQILIAPHAGYVYSGPVAGYSFKAVREQKVKTVVILAPSHFYGFDGASVWSQGGFQTPLGIVPVDEDFAKQLTTFDPKFYFDAQAYQKEHSLEVEIPFLQKTFSDFKIVPVILGQMSFEACQKLAKALNDLIGERTDILVVVSSDMSHYHDGQSARAMDLSTLEMIKSLNAQNLYKQCRLGTHEMCGFVPVTTALLLAQTRGLKVQVLKYAHSGDVTGETDRVVGYGAVVFYKDVDVPSSYASLLNRQQKQELLKLARQTIEEYVANKKIVEVNSQDKRLDFSEGAFVTIHKNGQLRGCIGHIVSEEPLQKTVRDMALAAASEDRRFDPVNVAELKTIDLEISVLSRPWRIKDISEITLGVHGVIIGNGRSHGVFLPQVAIETGWSKEEFLSQLCSQKAGLPANCWKDPATVIEVFTAQVFGENDHH